MASAIIRVSRLVSSNACSLRSTVITHVRSCNYAATNNIESLRHGQGLPNNVEDITLKTNNLKALYENVEIRKLKADKAVDIVSNVRNLLLKNLITVKDIESDSNFNAVCDVINNNIQTLNHITLIRTLKNFLDIGLPHDKFIINSVETEILWKLRKMSLKQLLHLLSFHIHYQFNDIQRKVVAETTEKIQQIWFEMNEAIEIILFYKLSHHFQSGFLGKVEDRAIEIIEMLPVDEQHKILVTLSEMKLRPIHLLRSIAFHLAKHSNKLNVKEMLNVVQAMNKLSFPDVALLQRISSDLVPEISQIEKSAVVGLFLTTFGQLKWRHLDVMNSFSDWIQKNETKCRVQDFLALILTSAHLNYNLDNESLVSTCLKHVTKETIKSNIAWLDFVWSLVILQKATHKHLTSVLNPDFCESIQTLNGYFPLVHGRKLLNINAAAKWESSGYKGPFLTEDFVKDCCKNLPETTDGLKNSVIATLSNNVPLGKFLTDSQYSESGFFIDGEFLVDENLKPLQLDYLDKNSKKSNTSNISRVALVVQTYKDFTLHNVTLTGQNEFAVRILKKLGYHVLQVPYFEYNSKDKTVKRLTYLQDKLVETIPKRKISDETTEIKTSSK